MSWKEPLRALKANLIRTRISKPPILIFAARRGGSTMLADAIACNRGVWFANEPFAVFPGHQQFQVKSRYLPRLSHSQFFDLSAEEHQQFESYVGGLLEGNIRSLGTCRSAGARMLADRVCLKILNANWMLPWFVENSSCDSVFLTRHPGSQAVSVLRQGWGFGVEAYFDKPAALRRYFTPDQIEFGQGILASSDRWRKAILDWVIINAPGLFEKNDARVTRVAYEHLVLNVESFTEQVLIGKLGLEARDRMLMSFASPSNSSTLSMHETRDAIVEGKRKLLISRWLDEITPQQSIAAQEILDRFNVELYSMDDPKPNVALSW